jgi:hypothetical protein
MTKGLNEWRDEALRIAVEHGFKDATIGEDVALFHSEASELLEDHRAGEDVNKVWYEEKVPIMWHGETVCDESGKPLTRIIRHSHPYPNKAVTGPNAGPYSEGPDYAHPYKPCGIPSEVADIIIRCLHFAGKHGIDIEARLTEKMGFNSTREFMHSKKL